MTPKLKLVKSTEEFRLLEPLWNDLLSQSPSNNYFLTWEWLWNWWQVFARKDDELAIFLLRKDDKVTGIAPFYVRKRHIGKIVPMRRMMFLGTQEDGDGDVGSDYMDVFYRDGEETSLINTLFMTIVEHNICDEIYFSKMDASAKTFRLIQEEAGNLGFFTKIANEYVSPYIQLPPTWGDYLNGLTSSMRYKIRNERRKLEMSGIVTVTRAENSETLTNYFKELVRLHNKRWESKGMQGAFSKEQFYRFHSGVMPSMLINGHLDMICLSENGSTRAVLYNIIYKNKIYFYQSGIDTFETKVAFGYLSHSYCIEEAIKRGMAEYDFLPKGGMDDYKDRFSTNHRTVADIYIARQWAVKHFAKAEESARSVYLKIKPYLLGAI